MKQDTRLNHPTGLSLAPGFLLGGALLLGLGSCGGGSSTQSGGSAGEPGALVEHPDADASSSKFFVVDANHGGQAAQLRLEGVRWGRLVDVYDQEADGTTTLIHRDYPIGDDVQTDAFNYLLSRNPVTSQVTLTIRHPFGSPAYESAFRALDTNLIPVNDAGLHSSGVYTMVPRNSAIVLVFNDLLDPELVTPDTVKVHVGSPPEQFFESRLIIDPNHGDLRGGKFYGTRVIVDTTISSIEAFEQVDQTLGVNGLGLPPSINAQQANVALRLPTLENPSVGQTEVLRNLRGNKLATSGNGTVDFSSSTVDVLRAMRSGGNQLVTGDPYNGFLFDEEPPELIGRQPGVILDAPIVDPDGADELDFIIPRFEFLSVFCAQTPAPGEVLQQSGIFVEVRELPAPHDQGLVRDLKVRLLLGDPDEWPSAAIGAAQFLSTYRPLEDGGIEACFVGIVPTPAGFPQSPSSGISPFSTFTLRFSEAMDPTSLTAFDSLTLTRVPLPQSEDDPPVSGDEYVIGVVQSSLDLLEFEFVPDLPLTHTTGVAESYFLNLVTTGLLAPSDLAGNPFAFTFPQIQARIDPNAAPKLNGGRVSRFSSPDEDEPIGDELGAKNEWNGQHLYDLDQQLIRPRPVVRQQAVADSSQPVPSLMNPFPLPIQTPLSSLGSKMQTVWRYADVGWSLTDVTNYNMDIEGLNWTPLGGQIIADHFNEFSISLAHSKYLPDEIIDPMTGFPAYPPSGLKKTFSTNLLDGGKDPFKIVHPSFLGYTLNPGDLFTTSTGTLMMPFPLNRDLPISEYQFYTFRDTALRTRGGQDGNGVDLSQVCVTLAQGQCGLQSAGNVQTIGLPLLMEFRCYPDDEALGLNGFEIALAVNTSARPNFRAFSTGGVDQGQQTQRVFPDLEFEANGGYNPISSPPGATTWGLDNSFYLGAMDTVTRISRSYSIWFEVTGVPLASAAFNPAVIEPQITAQPNGTDIRLHYRGAGNVNSVGTLGGPRYDAATLDGYGDYYPQPDLNRNPDVANTPVTFLNDDEWHGDISEINGANYYQIRVTFISNPETGNSPTLAALGVTWQDPTVQ